MASILTNSGSMAALQTLRSISNQMSTTQDRISSGLKVGSAADNAAYWSISTTMKAESSSMTVVGEALGMGSSLADVSSTAVQSVIDLMTQVRDRVVAAGESTNDRDKIQTELKELYSQIKSTVSAASFNGVNWLTSGDDTAKVLSGVTKVAAKAEVPESAPGAGDGEAAVEASTDLRFISVGLTIEEDDGAGGTTDKNVGAIVADVTGALDDSTEGLAIASDAEVLAALTAVDKAITGLTEIGSRFGAASTRIDTQKDFISNLTDAIDRGIGSLIDADMNEESTRLKALQTQQQLAVQSLSIANSSTDLILQLFR